ncbi:unnamed protein product [Lactuca saligna]|uniref:Uncharacterized protein n=1 Tax=Lactuca saligna TaxID=75948 RepID=A0AA36DZT3_LACSI|nr:unnamed protein product [Lactuca saligna]
MENKVMDALAKKTEKVKVLDQKLQKSENRVKDLIFEWVVVRSCITDVTGLLSDIIETRDSMISITIHKHLAERLNLVFAMLYHLQCVSPQSSDQKQGGEGASKEEHLKVLAKPIIKNEPKGKEKLIEEEPIIDNDEEEDHDKDELKRRKDRDAKLNETQRIVKEAEEKERAEREAHTTLKSRMLLFSKWTLNKIQHDAVELPNQYW